MRSAAINGKMQKNAREEETQMKIRAAVTVLLISILLCAFLPAFADNDWLIYETTSAGTYILIITGIPTSLPYRFFTTTRP